MRLTFACLLGGTLALTACGSVAPGGDGAPPPPADARLADYDAADGPDASPGPDAPPAVPPSVNREIGPGGARISGATYSMEVQVGHAINQGPMAGATYQVEGAASVKP